MKQIFLTWFSIVTLALSLRGQGFTNLDFESARLVFYNPPYNDLIATTNALPGWSFFFGTNQAPSVGYGGFTPTYYLSGLMGSNTADVISGNFSVAIGPNQSISQTGLVPSGTESLLFGSTSPYFFVSMDGQNLSYSVISNALNSYDVPYTVYAASISAFAGQTGTLTFSSPSPSYGILDDIQFSPEAVPEPSALSFLCLGSGVLFYVRKRRRFQL